jgi:hypothetical protein
MSQLALYLLGLPRVERDGEPVKVAGRKAMALRRRSAAGRLIGGRRRRRCCKSCRR